MPLLACASASIGRAPGLQGVWFKIRGTESSPTDEPWDLRPYLWVQLANLSPHTPLHHPVTKTQTSKTQDSSVVRRSLLNHLTSAYTS